MLIQKRRANLHRLVLQLNYDKIYNMTKHNKTQPQR